MLLKDTYKQSEKIELLKGNPISFTKYIFDAEDPFIKDISSVYSGIYLRSNNKTTSPIFDEYYSLEGSIEPRTYYFRPYNTNEDTGEEDFNLNDNTSQFLLVQDVTAIYISDYHTARFFIYDKTRNYLGYIPNTYVDKALIINKFPDAYYLTFTILSIASGYALSYSQINLSPSLYYTGFDDILNWQYYLGRYIRNTFINKWNKIYDALITEYKLNSPINLKVSTDGSDTDVNTKNQTDTLKFSDDRADTITKSFDNYNETDKLEYSPERKNLREEFYSPEYKENTEREISEKTTVTEKSLVDDYTFAFNSNDKVPTNSTQYGGENGDTSTTERLADNNKTTDIKSYTGSRFIGDTFEGSETHTYSKSGTAEDKRDYKGTETHTIFGSDDTVKNYGKIITTEGQKDSIIENINMELDLRSRNIFLNEIYKDIDSIITLQIYA